MLPVISTNPAQRASAGCPGCGGEKSVGGLLFDIACNIWVCIRRLGS